MKDLQFLLAMGVAFASLIGVLWGFGVLDGE